MWIVKVALQRPYTFIMLAVLIVLMGGYAILRTATDIFPNIKIPIAAVIWRYNGILPEEIANRIVLFSERVAQTTVNDVEHTESQSVNGTAVVKYFFQPDVDQDLSFAQITAVSQVQLAFSPPGTTPPFVLSYSASSVPILQLALSSDTLPEAKIYDLGNTILRTQLATVAGASIPFPFGGKQRQVQVDLDPQALRSNGLSPDDVVNAIGAQNLILPAGTEKIGSLEYFIKLNASPNQIEDLNNLPVRARNGTVTYVRDVAHVRDGYSPQTNMVRVDGKRSVLMSVLKTGKASTIDIINSINQKLPLARASMPPELKVEATSDQSVFVRSAISGVVREAVIAGALTGLLILLFLGSWRSTLIITISIPLSILVSVACLSALGETINIMTLGGLALAVGIPSSRARTSRPPSWTARIRLRCPRSCRRCASASCSFPCFCLPASRSSCSFPWRRPWYSPCWRPISCRGRWFRHSRNSGSRCMITMPDRSEPMRSVDFRRRSSTASSKCVSATSRFCNRRCTAVRALPASS